MSAEPDAALSQRKTGTVPSRGFAARLVQSLRATPPPTAESTLRIRWEDRTGESSDYDHNDLILEMTFVPLQQNPAEQHNNFT